MFVIYSKENGKEFYVKVDFSDIVYTEKVSDAIQFNRKKDALNFICYADLEDDNKIKQIK